MRPSSIICCRLLWCIILASSCSRETSACIILPWARITLPSSCHHPSPPAFPVLITSFIKLPSAPVILPSSCHHPAQPVLPVIICRPVSSCPVLSSCSLLSLLFCTFYHRFEAICIGSSCFSLIPILFHYILCFSTQLLISIVFHRFDEMVASFH